MVSLAKPARRTAGPEQVVVAARITGEDANHEDTAADFPDVHAARNARSFASAAAGVGLGRTTSHHIRVGRPSSRRSRAGHCAELLRPGPVQRRLCRPPCRLSDLHDDEFRITLPPVPIRARTGSTATWCMPRPRREGTQRAPKSIFPRRRSSRISAWSRRCVTHTREGLRWFRRC